MAIVAKRWDLYQNLNLKFELENQIKCLFCLFFSQPLRPIPPLQMSNLRKTIQRAISSPPARGRSQSRQKLFVCRLRSKFQTGVLSHLAHQTYSSPATRGWNRISIPGNKLRKNVRNSPKTEASSEGESSED